MWMRCLRPVATPAADRTHATAVARVRHGQPSVGGSCTSIAHYLTVDVFTREALKAIAQEALLGETSGQSVDLRHERSVAVERGIEARDLKNVGICSGDGCDRGVKRSAAVIEQTFKAEPVSMVFCAAR